MPIDYSEFIAHFRRALKEEKFPGRDEQTNQLNSNPHSIENWIGALVRLSNEFNAHKEHGEGDGLKRGDSVRLE